MTTQELNDGIWQSDLTRILAQVPDDGSCEGAIREGEVEPRCGYCSIIARNEALRAEYEASKRRRVAILEKNEALRAENEAFKKRRVAILEESEALLRSRDASLEQKAWCEQVKVLLSGSPGR